jgi:protein arginine kinase activator
MFIKPVVCTKCQKNLATVKITKIISGEVHDIHLCQECASELSPFQKKMSEYQKDLSDIISGLLKQEKGASVPQEMPKEAIDLVCDNCGFPFESYRKSFFLGCSQCYKVFNKHLINDIRKIHGSVQHMGRVPQKYHKVIEIKRSLENLKRDLQEAIRMENFERAAELRDQIRSINSEEPGE